MTLIQFAAELIKILSEFQSDWKKAQQKLGYSNERKFEDWLLIFKHYTLKHKLEDVVWDGRDEIPF